MAAILISKSSIAVILMQFFILIKIYLKSVHEDYIDDN